MHIIIVFNIVSIYYSDSSLLLSQGLWSSKYKFLEIVWVST